MTVEEKRGIVVEDEPGDRFPVGMRVLAVDDDPTCLMVLDTLLRRCRYHVTTTSQAVKALKLLRENKNKFDLVISDVHMPDMDGFKLLELVGLEMDLPVIMLSGNSDPKVVMKGITHGACDYLLKPVRIEELKNIWQHVIRRKKFDSRDQNNSNNPEKPATSDGGQGHPAGGNMDRNGKLNRKRKDQNEDDDEECEENGHENEDPSTQKKPRVVWSVDLHRKFVAAVNQLGIDKAVPKKILDMMNVERLTRENVASHLQKYRLYLKRISCVASQQANMVAALGGRDPSYLRMGSLDDLGDFHALTGSGQLPNAALASIPPGGMLGRLNTPAGCMRGLASSGMIQLGRAQNSSTSINDLGNLPQVVLSGNQNGNLLQGFPKSLELDQLQQSKYSSRIGEFASHIDDPSIFPAASGFSDTGVAIGSSSNSFFSVPNNPLMLQGHSQHRQSRGLGNQSSVKVAPLNPEPIDSGVTVSSHFPEQGRCNDNWQSAVPLVGFPSNQLPLSDPFIHADLSPGNLTDDISSMGSHIGNSPLDFSSTSIIPASLQDSRKDMQCPTSGLVGSNFHHDNPKFSSFGGLGNNVEQAMNYAPKQKSEDHKQDYAHNSNLIISSVNSSVPTHGVVGPLTHSFGQNNAVCNRGMDITLIGQSNRSAPYLMQHNEFEKSAMDTKMNLKEEYVMEQTKSMDGLIRNSCASLEDLMNAMIKREREEVTLMDGDIGFDGYPVRTCM